MGQDKSMSTKINYAELTMRSDDGMDYTVHVPGIDSAESIGYLGVATTDNRWMIRYDALPANALAEWRKCNRPTTSFTFVNCGITYRFILRMDARIDDMAMFTLIEWKVVVPGTKIAPAKQDNSAAICKEINMTEKERSIALALSEYEWALMRLRGIQKDIENALKEGDTDPKKVDLAGLLFGNGGIVEKIDRIAMDAECALEFPEVIEVIDELRKKLSPDVVVDNNICQAATLFDPSGKPVGVARNDDAIASVRVQIKHKQLEGYYWMFNGEKIMIDKNGNLDKYPDGFFSTFGDLMKELV